MLPAPNETLELGYVLRPVSLCGAAAKLPVLRRLLINYTSGLSYVRFENVCVVSTIVSAANTRSRRKGVIKGGDSAPLASLKNPTKTSLRKTKTSWLV